MKDSTVKSKELQNFFKFITVVILLFVYFLTTNKMIQVLSCFLLFLIVLSWSYSKIISEHLIFRRTLKEFRINRRDFFEVTIEVTNKSFLPVSFCELTDDPSPLNVKGYGGRFCFSIGARRKIYLKYEISGDKRGEFFIGPLVLKSGDPLGFFKFEISNKEKSRVLILPAKHDMSLKIQEGAPQGKIIVKDKKYEDLSLYRSVRDYQNGDELKRINWKASARFGKLFTNEYQCSIDSPFFVYLNMFEDDYPSQFRHQKIEECVEIAASLLVYGNSLKQNCGFSSNGIINSNNEELNSEQNIYCPFFPVKNGQIENLLDLTALVQSSTKKHFDDKKISDLEILKKTLWSLPKKALFIYVGPKEIKEEIKSLLAFFERKLIIKYFTNEE